MPSIRSCENASNSGASTPWSRLSELRCYGDLILTAKLLLMLIIMFCLSIGSYSPFAHATKDYVVPVSQSERRMPTVTVTASRSRGGVSGLVSISMSGGGFSPFGAYTPFGDEYFFMLSCSRRRDDTSDICKNICRIFPDSPKCPDANKNKLPIPDSGEEILPPVTVSENRKKDDRKKLNLFNYSGPPTLVLKPVEAVVPCYATVTSRLMKFPTGTHRARRIVSGDYYIVHFDEEELYKLVREAANELALPGKDGKAVDWRRKQEGGFYIYWNRKTGKFRIGRITLGELHSSSVSVDYRYDNKTTDEVRIGRLHTQPSGTAPSFQDIISSKRLANSGTLSSFAKEFIASVSIDEFGKEYVELKMYDLIGFPWSEKKIIEYRDKQVSKSPFRYPYELLAKISIEILRDGKISRTNKVLTDC